MLKLLPGKNTFPRMPKNGKCSNDTGEAWNKDKARGWEENEIFDTLLPFLGHYVYTISKGIILKIKWTS